MVVQIIDSLAARVMRMKAQGDPVLLRAREMVKAGKSTRDICVALGWHPTLLSRFKALEDPKSAVSIRIKTELAVRAKRKLVKQRQAEQRRVARQVRGKVAELRRAPVPEPLQYEQFLARERGEPEPGRRIPLLDYSEEDERETDTARKRAWRGEFRRLSRSLLTVQQRVEILVKHAKSDDPGVSMKALHELHQIEGAIRKPLEGKAPAGGALFSLPAGSPIQLGPVGSVDLPSDPTREPDPS